MDTFDIQVSPSGTYFPQCLPQIRSTSIHYFMNCSSAYFQSKKTDKMEILATKVMNCCKRKDTGMRSANIRHTKNLSHLSYRYCTMYTRWRSSLPSVLVNSLKSNPNCSLCWCSLPPLPQAMPSVPHAGRHRLVCTGVGDGGRKMVWRWGLFGGRGKLEPGVGRIGSSGAS